MEAITLIDIINPEHNRTSCSDDNISNGFYFEYDEYNDKSDVISRKYPPRCSRCALLEIENGTVALNKENKKIINEWFN